MAQPTESGRDRVTLEAEINILKNILYENRAVLRELVQRTPEKVATEEGRPDRDNVVDELVDTVTECQRVAKESLELLASEVKMKIC